MSSHDRRAAGRRRAWGRGPIILKLESLERRALLAADGQHRSPDLVNSALTVSSSVADWGNTVEVEGRVTNQGERHDDRPVPDHDLCLAHPGHQQVLRADRRR